MCRTVHSGKTAVRLPLNRGQKQSPKLPTTFSTDSNQRNGPSCKSQPQPANAQPQGTGKISENSANLACSMAEAIGLKVPDVAEKPTPKAYDDQPYVA